MEDNKHYLAILEHYGTKRANRSQVPLMAHIQEGLRILDAIGGTTRAKEAFCLHPMLQDDKDLRSSLEPGSPFLERSPDPDVVALAMEYRTVANAYLSHHYRSTEDEIRLSGLQEVNNMLIADKVQNRKDFEIHHLGRHERSDVLSAYFNNWLRRLGISEARYQELAALSTRA